MKILQWAAALACVSVVMGSAAWAQKSQSADFIVAVVNSEPITNAQVQAAMRRVVLQLKQQQQTVPSAAELQEKVLERLINDRAQLQLARDMGIRMDDSAVDQAEASLAQQNKIDLPTLHQRMAKEGISSSALREQLRDQLTLTRLHEREVDARLRISDQELDRYMQEEQAKNTDPLNQQINLGQLLVAVPEKASPAQTAQLYAQAQALLQRARAGESFEALVKTYSNAVRENSGQLGLRRADRYPSSFVEATRSLEVGQISDIVTSGAGFHILKLLDRQAPNSVTRFVQQTRARHILLRTGPDLSQSQALAKLAEFRQAIQSGKTTFANAARDYSQDGSAPQGGDLGWATPGMFVPEFEEVMNQLSVNDISAPLVSRFGVHLIQVTDRRRMELSPAEVREWMRNELRQSKLEENYLAWAKDVRNRAFVELRDPPL